MEHCMLVAILHANVGTEVGAFILQEVVLKFNSEFMAIENTDDDDTAASLNNLIGLSKSKISLNCMSFCCSNHQLSLLVEDCPMLSGV